MERDGLGLSATALLFTLALGISSVAFPFVALEMGRGASDIGVLVALSAVVQIVARSRLGAVMRRVPDRALLGFAPLALTVSFVVLAAWTSFAALTAAWLILGLGRACFWTAGQTHAVRASGQSMKRLASLNFFGSLGTLVGPAVAGLLSESGTQLALQTGAAVALVSFLPTLWLDRFPAFARTKDRHERSVWRRPGVGAACWSGATAGAWRGLMDRFVLVALERARHSSATIGLLVSVANGAAVIGAVLVGRLRPTATPVVYAVSTVSAGLGIAALGPVAGPVPAAAIALAVSGLGAGVLQTLGPAVAASAVGADEKGDVMAVYGTWRTTAMFAVPLAAAGAVVVVPVSAVLLVVGSTLALPTLAVRSLRRGLPPASPPAPAS